MPRSARKLDRQQALDARESEIAEAGCRLAGRKNAHARQGGQQPPLRAAAFQPPRMQSVFAGGGLLDLEKLTEMRRAGSTSHDGASTPENLYESKEQFDRLATAVAQLSRRHRRVIELYYYRELSMKQIGEMLG